MTDQDVADARQQARRRWLRMLALSTAFAVVVAVLGASLGGKIGLEKTLTSLVMPVGLMWLLLSGWALHQLMFAPGRALWAVLLWLLFTVAGTSPLSDTCLRYIETSVTSYDPDSDAPLDMLVVLGGGTKQGPTRAQAGGGGDRVVYAAQLYIQGKAKRLITTGDALPGLPGAPSGPRQHTVEIWTKLGIDPAAIGTLSGPNTYAEIQSLKQIMPELENQRVGLLTSAFHLPRAMRLAKQQGLDDLIPVAADYQFNVESYSFTDFIPSAGSFCQLARVQHEWMARLVAR